MGLLLIPARIKQLEERGAERGKEQGKEQGRQENNAAWLEWNRRRIEAEAQGQPFNEPNPAQTNH